MFLNDPGTNFDDFWCLGDRVEIGCFLMAVESQRLRAHGQRKVIGF